MKQDLWTRLLLGSSPSTKKALGIGQFPQYSRMTPIWGSFNLWGKFKCNLMSTPPQKTREDHFLLLVSKSISPIPGILLQPFPFTGP